MSDNNDPWELNTAQPTNPDFDRCLEHAKRDYMVQVIGIVDAYKAKLEEIENEYKK